MFAGGMPLFRITDHGYDAHTPLRAVMSSFNMAEIVPSISMNVLLALTMGVLFAVLFIYLFMLFYKHLRGLSEMRPKRRMHRCAPSLFKRKRQVTGGGRVIPILNQTYSLLFSSTLFNVGLTTLSLRCSKAASTTLDLEME